MIERALRMSRTGDYGYTVDRVQLTLWYPRHGPIPGHGKAFVEAILEMFVVWNIVEDGKLTGPPGDGECLWNTEMTYIEFSPKASCLYSIEVPDAEGGTGFLNMHVTYNALPDGVKQRIEGLTISHETQSTLDWFCRNGGPSLEAVNAVGIFDVSKLPGINHPIVRKHPETGRKGNISAGASGLPTLRSRCAPPNSNVSCPHLTPEARDLCIRK